jgi:hypothetical protein
MVPDRRRCLDFELALQPIDDDLELQLPRRADRHTAGRIGGHGNGRILGHDLAQPVLELVAVARRLGVNCEPQ